MGILLKHSWHFLVFGAIGPIILSRNVFIGIITKKYTAKATNINDIKAFKRSPYRIALELIVKLKPAKLGTLSRAEISGVRKSFTNVEIMVLKEAPITTPTAKSTEFPLTIKFLNPSKILGISHS